MCVCVCVCVRACVRTSAPHPPPPPHILHASSITVYVREVARLFSHTNCLSLAVCNSGWEGLVNLVIVCTDASRDQADNWRSGWTTVVSNLRDVSQATRPYPPLLHSGSTRPYPPLLHSGSTRPYPPLPHSGSTRPYPPLPHSGSTRPYPPLLHSVNSWSGNSPGTRCKLRTVLVTVIYAIAKLMITTEPYC